MKTQPVPSENAGMVYLIGAGPGDPGLLTLRGLDRLQKSDVVLYDGLSNPELLRHAPQAEHLSVGKHGQSRIWKQPEIIQEMLRHAAAGKTVARLKGGDPAVFARTSEEVDALRAANVPFEIIPGITAALAAGSFAGIPITHRGLASAVALVTGHEEPGKSQSALDWDALARFPGTLVVYMGVTTAKTWTNQLMAAGKDPATPTAIIRRCSLPDQQSIHCRLDEVAGHLTPASKFRPPVITLIGPVTELAPSMDWVTRRPLHGQTIMVTRPAEKAETLAAPLRDLGANVLVHPAIETGPLADLTGLDDSIARIHDFSVIVFCSENGVRHFLDRLLQQDQNDLRVLHGKTLACVGEKTAKFLLDQYHLKADLIPESYDSDALATQILAENRSGRGLVIRASRGRDTLAKTLQHSSLEIEEVIAYENRDRDSADPAVAQALQAGQIDWITITSSATAQNLHRLFGDEIRKAKLATLSPVTSQTVQRLGYQVAAEANPYTIESLIDVIVKS